MGKKMLLVAVAVIQTRLNAVDYFPVTFDGTWLLDIAHQHIGM
jgi:hypothetical protein